jgi:hypothetical protein
MHDFAAYEAGLTGFIKDDPLFASATGAELRRSSPAFTCGEVPTADNYGADYYKYAATDYFGRPISFVDGRPVAGADMLGVFSIFDKRGFEVTDASAEVTQLAGGKVELPAGCSLVADIPATETEVREYFIKVTVAEGAELKVTLDEIVATYGGGTHLLRVKTAEAARAMQLAAVDGLVEIASLKNNVGAVLLLR